MEEEDLEEEDVAMGARWPSIIRWYAAMCRLIASCKRPCNAPCPTSPLPGLPGGLLLGLLERLGWLGLRGDASQPVPSPSP